MSVQNMASPDFNSLHQHGFVRVAAATPLVTTANPVANAKATVELARQAHAEGVDVVVFPELGLSSYAIDDLIQQDTLLEAVTEAVDTVRVASASLHPLLYVGAPLRHLGRLYNCAIAIHRGRVLGMVPKTYLPNYREYYEKRWFTSGAGIANDTIAIGKDHVPFGTDLLFGASDLKSFVIAVDICEDYWSPIPPSSFAALAGATVLVNLSASNVTIGKSSQRALLSASQSSRAIAGYVFSAAGTGESTTDMAWDGQGTIHELGECLASSERFSEDPVLLVADVDIGRIAAERLRVQTFADSAAHLLKSRVYRTIAFACDPARVTGNLKRPLQRFPYVPADDARLAEDCYEAFNIQVHGLVRRFRATSGSHMIIGVSGGLDSTHALIVAAKACDRLELPRTAIKAFTLPGFATSKETKANAWSLMKALGVEAAEIDIRPAAEQMLKDIGHPYADGKPLYDLTFENVQAGLRTDYLFRLAGQRGGFVIGTGDLSELALGWCTYGVGDQMSHYGVNAGVPKTLMQHLIRWVVATNQFDEATGKLLTAILDTKISPELIPAEEAGMQSTEDRIGPYALHDFFLFHILKYGMPPSKVAYLAWQTWRDTAQGEWPAEYPEAARQNYSLEEIDKWLGVFLDRFFRTSQYKRSALPNGPKVSSGGALSPRGDWRAPSDAVANVWLDELSRNGPKPAGAHEA
jgi:NAD+ synthase (glutamine-hydrolysing)